MSHPRFAAYAGNFLRDGILQEFPDGGGGAVVVVVGGGGGGVVVVVVGGGTVVEQGPDLSGLHLNYEIIVKIVTIIILY